MRHLRRPSQCGHEAGQDTPRTVGLSGSGLGHCSWGSTPFLHPTGLGPKHHASCARTNISRSCLRRPRTSVARHIALSVVDAYHDTVGTMDHEAIGEKQKERLHSKSLRTKQRRGHDGERDDGASQSNAFFLDNRIDKKLRTLVFIEQTDGSVL